MSNDLITFNERALQPNGDVWFVREKKLMKAEVSVVDRAQWNNEETGKKEVAIVARVKEGDLKPGDTVVVSPLSQPTVGTKVNIAGDSPQEEPGKVAATNSGDDADQTN